MNWRLEIVTSKDQHNVDFYGGNVYWNNNCIKYLPMVSHSTPESVQKSFDGYVSTAKITPIKGQEGRYFLNDRNGEFIIELN